MNRETPDTHVNESTETNNSSASKQFRVERTVAIALEVLSEEERDAVNRALHSYEAFVRLTSNPANVASLSGSRGAKTLSITPSLRLVFEESAQGVRVLDLVVVDAIDRYTTFKYDVFLSYSSKDKARVRALAESLKRDGLRVWFDEWEIVPGDLIDSKVGQGLAESRTLVLCMSKNAFAVEWPILERHTAIFRDSGNINRRFVPLRLDDTEINNTLKQFAYIDWRQQSAEEYARLLAACRMRINTVDKNIVQNHTPTHYTNAKVLLVGDSGVGKTGLALRLTENRFEPTVSTDAVWATQLKLPHETSSGEIERGIWLWDFGGQADYRLIHQLFMDEASLAVLVFDPQSENPFEGLGQWDRDLQRAARRPFRKLLVAARCDRGGLMVSRKSIESFCQERGFDDFLETSAYTGAGCSALRDAIIRNIPWDDISWIASPRTFKVLKEEIIKLKDEGKVLLRMSELKQQLELRLPGESFTLEQLRAVVGLLASPGVVWQLEFGDFVLLQPERVNAYAAAVIRKVRAHTEEIGIIPEEDVLDGRLNYQDMKRLPSDEEQIVLRAMHQTFVDHGLCLREPTEAGTLLVFPSYFKRERPELGSHPAVFVTYQFNGQLDEIYSTLVVRLHHTSAFKKDQLWQFAADFKTQTDKRVGLKMTKLGEGAAEIAVYFDSDIPDDTKVTFIRYVYEHLNVKAKDVIRLRHYFCPHCNAPVRDREAALERVNQGLKDIICIRCEKRILLWDLIEQKFASEEFQRRVRELEEQARLSIDNESRELILIGHAFAVASEAGQIFRQTANSDWGVDGEIEFKNDKGQASGRRVYLQLKPGDSYLQTRNADGREIFTIKNLRHAEYWQSQAFPVMLVIRTSDGHIRWMNVTDYRRKHGTETRQIVFDGEPFTALSLVRLRDRLLR